MKTLKYIGIIMLLIIVWTAILAYGITDGFLLKSIASKDNPEEFVEATNAYLEDQFVGNFALAIIENGKLKKTKFHSVDQTIDEHTLFQVASVSKWVTSVGIMKLVQDDELNLDKPVNEYLTRWRLPKSKFDNGKVTIRRLLSHSSGLTDDLGYEGFAPDEEIQTIEESLTKAADAIYSDGIAQVGIEPGSEYMYSGAAYTILQLIIEEVTGMSFQEYMIQNVFQPLEMNNSTFILPKEPNSQVATWYLDDGSKSPPIKFTALAAASLYTNIEDMSKFMIATISGNKILNSTTVTEMTTPTTFINDIGVYGLGPHLYSQSATDSKVIGHDGSSNRPVINTAARIDMLTKNGIIIFEMGSPNLASQLADEWLFWEAGIADFVVIERNKSYLLTLLLIGYVLIIILSIIIIRKNKTKVQLTES